MKILKYLSLDLKHRKGIVAIFLSLVTVMMLLIGHTIEHTKESYEALEQIQNFRNASAYIAKDSTEDIDVQRIGRDETALERIAAFYNRLGELDIMYYTEFGYDIRITSSGVEEKQRSVTKNFFDVFQIKSERGRLFTEEEYLQEQQVCPVVIGYELASEYELNGIYEFENGGKGEVVTGKVVGVLPKNTEFYRLNAPELPISLDSMYVFPISSNFTGESLSFSDYDMAITHTVIFDRKDQIEQIQKEYNQMNLFRTTFVSADEQIEELTAVQKNAMFLLLGVIGCLLLCTLICMWIAFYKMIKQQMTEYAVHMICGASTKDIFLRFITFVYMIVLVGTCLTLLILRDITLILPMMGVGVLIGVLVLLFPLRVIKKLSVVEIMRKE